VSDAATTENVFLELAGWLIMGGAGL